MLSQFLHAPRLDHMDATKRVLRYLKCTSYYGLFFPANNSLVLQGFSDSDWGGNPVDRRSVGAYTFLLGNAAIFWRSKNQSVTSRSSAEVEYRALADASCEVMWLQNLLVELGLQITGSVPIYCDSKSAIDLTENPVYHASTKHIEIDCHFIREKIKTDLISASQISTKVNAADILTKGLGKVPHWSCCSKLSIVSFSMPVISGGNTKIVDITDSVNEDSNVATTCGFCIKSSKESSIQRGG